MGGGVDRAAPLMAARYSMASKKMERSGFPWRGRLAAFVADRWLGWCYGNDRPLILVSRLAECKPHLDRGEAASSSPGQALPSTESSDMSGKRVVSFLIVRSEGFARLSRRW